MQKINLLGLAQMDDNQEDPRSQMVVNITLGSIIASAINGIVGFIAIYFFKPIWEKLVGKWSNK